MLKKSWLSTFRYSFGCRPRRRTGSRGMLNGSQWVGTLDAVKVGVEVLENRALLAAATIISDHFAGDSGAVPAGWTDIGFDSDAGSTVVESGTVVTITDTRSNGGPQLIQFGTGFGGITAFTLTVDVASSTSVSSSEPTTVTALGQLGSGFAFAVEFNTVTKSFSTFARNADTNTSNKISLPSGPHLPSYDSGVVSFVVTGDADSFRITSTTDGYDSGDVLYSAIGLTGFDSIDDLGTDLRLVMGTESAGSTPTGTLATIAFDRVDLTVTSQNVPPTVTANSKAIIVASGQVAKNSGTFADKNGDFVKLSASTGNVEQFKDGTWAWTSERAAVSGTVTIFASAVDREGNDGGKSSVAFDVKKNTTTTEITSFTPVSGLTGTSVIITGDNFTGATEVKFGSLAARAFKVDSATQITVKVPVGVPTGKISVRTPRGTAVSADLYYGAPRIDQVGSGFALAGTVVTLSGLNFTGVIDVRFGDVSAAKSLQNVKDNSLQVTVPADAITGFVTIVTLGGTAKSRSQFKVSPKIDGFKGTHAAAGAVVAIFGNSFTGATLVKFGSAVATFKVVSNNQINATVPTTAKTGPISVSTLGGIATSNANFTRIFIPKISSFSQKQGNFGDIISITGTEFAFATDVKFGGVSTKIESRSATEIKVRVPFKAITGTISVTNPAGTVTSKDLFTVLSKEIPPKEIPPKEIPPKEIPA